MLTKGAIGNLVNQYKAVLKKCRLINVFGSLAVASMLVLGSAGMAAGATIIAPSDTITDDFTGGKGNLVVYKTSSSDISNETLKVEGGKQLYRVYTASATKDGDTHHNKMIATGGKFVGNSLVCAGNSQMGRVYNNITIARNTNTFNLNAGISEKGDVEYNELHIEGTARVSDSAIAGQTKVNKKLQFNKVIYAGTGDSYIGLIHGGRLLNADAGTVNNNSIEVRSGEVDTIYGGTVVGSGSATKNDILITGGTVDTIHGGYVDSWGTADENTITITGGSIKNLIIGGITHGTSDTDHAIGNKITIAGSPDLSNASIYGGDGPAGADFRTGNTLNIKTSGLIAKNIYNFDTINFTVASKVRPGETLLKLNGGDETDLTDVAVSVTVEPRTDVLKKGDRIHLLKNDSNLVGEAKGEVDSIPYGNFVTYDFALDQTQTTLDLEVVNASTTPQAKSLSEGRTAMLAFVNQGAELIAERGMEAARQEALEGSLTPFLAGQGGKSRYDTGSHVDVTGFSLIAGLTSAKKTEIGTATMAAFFESGWADYDAHNSFASAASVNADGNTRYYGGGLLAHMAFPDFGPGHAYAETSLRTGWAETDYHSGDLRDSFGNTAAYDSGSAYYGAHFGLGYEWKLSDVSALDFYAKYFWTHQEGDHVRVMSDPIHFESADSHRSRFGVRYEHEFKTDGMVVKPFIGAAYEYEYDGDVAGTAYGFTMDKPCLRGGTGAGELGMTLKSSENSAFSLNLSVQGYTGTREGVSGSFLLNYRF